MTSIVSHLSEMDKPAILRHLQLLTQDGIRLRFGTAMTNAALATYVDSLNVERDVLLGVMMDDVLVAFMHVAMVSEPEGVRELGVSVLDSYRRQGLAAQLLRYTKDLAFYCRWNRLEMMHVRENTAIARLCKKEGLYVTRDGIELVGAWESVHAYQHSVEQEAPYLLNVLEDSHPG